MEHLQAAEHPSARRGALRGQTNRDQWLQRRQSRNWPRRSAAKRQVPARSQQAATGRIQWRRSDRIGKKTLQRPSLKAEDRAPAKQKTRLVYDWNDADRQKQKIVITASSSSTDPFTDPFDDRLAQADTDLGEDFDDITDDLSDLLGDDEGLGMEAEEEEIGEPVIVGEEEELREPVDALPSDDSDPSDLDDFLDIPPEEPEPESDPHELLGPEDATDEPSYPEPAQVRPEQIFPYEEGEEDESAKEAQEDDEGSDGDRVYNEYNCTEDEEYCREKWVQLRGHDITNVSLDITPSFDPNAADEEKAQSKQDEQLAKSGYRTWLSRNGNVLANGQFQDFRNGRVYIAGDNGSIVSHRYTELSDDDACFVAAWWGLPYECRLGDDPFECRNWMPLTFTWKASALCHKPLYFEQKRVERYGHSFGPIAQPIISGAHFFGHFITLPYQMGIHPPHECEYALGHYRPGSCAPYLFPPLPLSIRGGILQAGATVGLIYAIP